MEIGSSDIRIDEIYNEEDYEEWFWSQNPEKSIPRQNKKEIQK
jgi:hypothetical protein